jgi:ketosteroid isomerase-like protein
VGLPASLGLNPSKDAAMSAEAHDLIARHNAAWNSQNLEALGSLYAEDVVFQNHTAGEDAIAGRDAVLAHIGGIFERWPDMGFTSRRLYITPDLCVGEWTAQATTSDGRQIEWDGVDVMPIRNGVIARKDVYSTSHIARVREDMESPTVREPS